MISESKFKNLLGEYATTVTVVTTRIDDQLAGLTVSSFCSVSLNPALIQVCVEKDARTNELLTREADFTVNILRDDQEDISQRFAEPGLPMEERLKNLQYSLPERGGPILTESLAWMTCEQYETTDGGDHMIYVGEVLDGDTPTDGDPLIYHKGRYGSFTE